MYIGKFISEFSIKNHSKTGVARQLNSRKIYDFSNIQKCKKKWGKDAPTQNTPYVLSFVLLSAKYLFITLVLNFSN